MAQPWQADFYDCHKEEREGDEERPYYYMWWTAQRPDDTWAPGADAQAPWVRHLGRQTLSVESAQYGWWYVAPFSSDKAIACLMSDVDILRAIGADHPSRWQVLLLKTQLLGMMTIPRAAELRLQALPCETAILTEVTGEGWVAIGDAASVFDPLASAGVMKAIHDGRIAAEAIHEYLSSGSVVRLREYAGRAVSEFQQYLAVRRSQYRLERRWPDAQFWDRRRN